VSFALAAAAAASVVAQSGSQSGAQSGRGSGPQSGGTTKPSPEQQPPIFRTEANFVRVDVYPTKDGTPVQDLRAEDFEVLEDGARQSIETFEHVVVRPAGPQALRSEPSTIGESRQLAANPRNRVFVLFLDPPHVGISSTWNVREPLIKLIDRVLGPDDLIGIMTPKMSARDVVLARKTEIMASGLRDRWPWGERDRLSIEEEDALIEYCYPRMSQDTGLLRSPVAAELLARRRERLTLDALRELVLHLRDVREERKAIITVTEGWLLYRPNQALTAVRTDQATGAREPIPGPEPISVGPDGRITTRNTKNSTAPVNRQDCDAQRLALSMYDDDQYFRDIIGEANRGNASFYTIDPRGLAVFDTPMGPEPPAPLAVDSAMLRNRIESIRTLAEATDGIAVVNSNDLDAGLRRVSDDLSSYYLLGYYSTNGRPDGRFHNIKVRVKRPGVDVRARKGYRSATAAEVSAARVAASTPVPEGVAMVTSAIAALSRIRPEARFSLNAVPIRDAGSSTIRSIWVAGELFAMPGTDPWAKGGAVDLTISSGGNSTTARVTLAPGERAFALPVALTSPAESGSVQVRAALSGADPDAERLAGSLTLDAGQKTAQPLLFRRGPTTANRVVPAATFLFGRTERARLEFPVGADAKATGGRLLDRANQPLAVPVAVGERTDAQSGQRWLTADITLAALAAGDYAVELTIARAAGEQRVLTAIRVGR
jgi:VWFA-related protein